ncbi:thymidylate synthase [Streptococcus iniae]|uniref:Thymidylate synthase n=1 Tax=Streptococcus iniae TaxID=1346 RepID=A0A3L8GLK3_STRIN|nr:thymidylate synthase [Streptococcus iniae]EKB51414.1 thymidylate synthase [Streptococcus iniae 9117]ESR09469.1 hypothetical protein IUSA1_06740 [Streptococcus iniae IUSA1]AHY17214.1 thymidylate synthase [Streptococcus iniae]AJG25523.1 thymidylate synthase [Streptococcus iniae]
MEIEDVRNQFSQIKYKLKSQYISKGIQTIAVASMIHEKSDISPIVNNHNELIK